MRLSGRLRVEPFGKGTDGVRLLVDGGRSWILSYRAEGILKRLDGKEVEVSGRECDKQFEALAGRHFDLERVEWIEPQ